MKTHDIPALKRANKELTWHLRRRAAVRMLNQVAAMRPATLVTALRHAQLEVGRRLRRPRQRQESKPVLMLVR